MAVKLIGRFILTGDIELKSGLHIGGAAGALAIGNLDLPVIREAISGRPYIPGSSLKGKMRSLSEKLLGAPQEQRIGKDVYIHVAQTEDQYKQFWVNPIFGVPAEVPYDVPAPNRLIVRDVPLGNESAAKLEVAKTDLPYSEIKWEAAIDRVTSAATPRQIERVPAGAVFTPMEIVFSAYEPGDATYFRHVLTALKLVQDDYLGGQGSRGSGKVAFNNLTVTWRGGAEYTDDVFTVGEGAHTLDSLMANATLDAWLQSHLV